MGRNEMRLRSITLGLVLAILVSACDFWPKELKPLAESLTQQLAGDTTAWLLGGNMVMIDVAGSPSYRQPQSELEALATGVAEQTIEYSTAPLESILITFHEGEVSDDPDRMREFIFLVLENRPVLQPHPDLDATGPLTVEEIRAAVHRLDESHARLGKPLTEVHRQCVLGAMEKRAHDAGDPETLDPASLEYLATETWSALDAGAKRIILMQAIMTKASFDCASAAKTGLNP